MQSKIEEFKTRGYANLGSSFLETKEIEELCQITKQIYDSMPKDNPDFLTDKEGGVEGVLNLPLHSARIGQIINKIVSQPNFKEFQKEIIGTNCKIWDISFRRSKFGNKGLYLHQDGVGQVNISICLDNNPEGVGATAVLPGSHLILRSMKQLRAEAPRFIINLFSGFFARLSGKAGDVSFLCNRIWHGRFENKSNTEHDVLTLGFFPDGYRYSEPWPQDLIKTFEGTTLGYLLASAEDLECSITSNCECRESDSVKFLDTHGYSIAIENPNYLALIRHPWRLTIAVQTLRLIMWCARFIIPVHRFLKRG